MIYRGVPLPSMFLSYQWGHWIFCWGGGWGGGGGDILFGYYVFMFCLSLFCFRCFGLVVYSIVSCSHMSCVLFLVLHAVVGSV